MISISAMLHDAWGGNDKTWEHDRLMTVGSSEVGQCIRKLWFSKNEETPDDGYTDRFGARLRGDIIERHYWVPGLLAALPEGVQLLFAGDEQRTLVDGYLSATSDGLLVGVQRDCLKHLGIDDIGSDCLVVECKTIDPRVDIKVEKPEHSFQTQVQMGLIRHATKFRPNYALISYIDASFLDDIREFAVKFDPAIYSAAQRRAKQVMTGREAIDFSAEGKIAGGNECRYCAWSSRCAHVTVAGVPQKDDATLGANAAAELKALRDRYLRLSEEYDSAEVERAEAQEAIREFLRANGVRGHKGEDWSVSWSTVKGRKTLDAKALEEAGVDLSPYYKDGNPGDRLTVK